MEPYILTRVTMENSLKESQKDARTGMRRNAPDESLLRQVREFAHRHLNASAVSPERISMENRVSYW